MSEDVKDRAERPCDFMSVNNCQKFEVGDETVLDICRLCIMGRMEGHLFDIKVSLNKKSSRNHKNQDQHQHWSDKDKG